MRPFKKGLLAGIPAALVGLSLLSLHGGRPSAVSAGGLEQGPAPAPKKKPDVTYEPTTQHIVDKMLELAELKKGDVIYDLGCGDGRIPITAAKRFGVKAVGIEIDPELVRLSKENAKKNGVADLVTIKQDDIFQIDLSEASVVTLYLRPHLNVKLMPQLAKLKPGTRILSHLHDMKGAKPKKLVMIEDRPGVEHEIYLWVVPWEKE